MKVSVIQMDVKFCDPEYNYANAQKLIKQACELGPDVVVLPETWNTGFFPKQDLISLCDNNLKKTKQFLGTLAQESNINIIGGSVSNIRCNKLYNTATVFNRKGQCVLEYDKTHLFTPMEENIYYQAGNRVAEIFELDGVRCGLAICYDIRFPELIRTISIEGVDIFFLVSQWPESRISHLLTLSQARAVENQMFFVCSNACGNALDTKYGGNSSIINPWGIIMHKLGCTEEIGTCNLNLNTVLEIRQSISVYNDRRPDLYKL